MTDEFNMRDTLPFDDESDCESDCDEKKGPLTNQKGQLIWGDLTSPVPVFGKFYTVMDKAMQSLRRNKHNFLFKWTQYAFNSTPSVKDFVEKYLLDAESKPIKNAYFHEVMIESKPVRLVGDLDCERKYIADGVTDFVIVAALEELIDEALTKFVVNFDCTISSKIRWLSACNDKKLSYHFVLCDKSFISMENQRQFWQAVQRDCLIDEKYECLHYYNDAGIRKCIIDFQVYSKNHSMRTIYSGKPKSEDEKRILKPMLIDPDSCTAEEIKRPTKEQIIEYFATNTEQYVEEYTTINKTWFYTLNDEAANKRKMKAAQYVFHSVEGKKPCDVVKMLCEPGQALSDYKFKEEKGSFFILTNCGGKCLIKKSTHKSNNAYCYLRRDGIYFGCHDDDCKGKREKVHAFKAIDGCEYEVIQTEDDKKKKERLSKKEEKRQAAHNGLTQNEKEYVEMITNGEKGLAKKMFELHAAKIMVGRSNMKIYNEETAYWMDGEESTAQGILCDWAMALLDSVTLPVEHAKFKERSYLRKQLTTARSGSNIAKLVKQACRNEHREWNDLKTKNIHLLPIAGKKVVDLRDKTVHDRLPEHYFNWSLDIAPDPNPEKRKKVDQYMMSLMNDKEKLVRYLQKVFGYALTGGQQGKALFVFYGPGGSNGKSKLISAFKKLLGRKCRSLDGSAIFEQQTKTAHQANIVLHKEARASICSELIGTEKFDLAQVKKWTGDDGMTARNAGAAADDDMEYNASSKIFIVTNDPPICAWKDDAMVDRLHFVPFDVKFVATQAEVDMNPKKCKLRDSVLVEDFESNPAALLDWMLDGAKLFYEEGGANANWGELPKEVTLLKKKISSSQDTVACFIEKMIVITDDKKDRVKVSDIKLAYSQFCNTYTKTALSAKEFVETFEQKTKNTSKKVTTGNVPAFTRMKLKDLTVENDAQEDTDDDDAQSVAPSVVQSIATTEISASV